MKLPLLLSILCVLVGCARTPTPPATTEDFLGIGFQYNAARQLEGADLLGRSPKEVGCEQQTASIMSDSYERGLVPTGHTLSTTCLHVEFTGPIKHGMVVVQPFSGPIVGFVAIAVQYTSAGTFYGAEKLGEAPDAKSCESTGHDTIDSTYSDGKVPDGNSVLIYCVPAPAISDKGEVGDNQV